MSIRALRLVLFILFFAGSDLLAVRTQGCALAHTIRWSLQPARPWFPILPEKRARASESAGARAPEQRDAHARHGALLDQGFVQLHRRRLAQPRLRRTRRDLAQWPDVALVGAAGGLFAAQDFLRRRRLRRQAARAHAAALADGAQLRLLAGRGQLRSGSLIRMATAKWEGTEVACILISRQQATTPTAHPGTPLGRKRISASIPRPACCAIHSEAPGIYSVYDYNGGIQFHGRVLPRQTTIVEGGTTVLTDSSRQSRGRQPRSQSVRSDQEDDLAWTGRDYGRPFSFS